MSLLCSVIPFRLSHLLRLVYVGHIQLILHLSVFAMREVTESHSTLAKSVLFLHRSVDLSGSKAAY